MRAHKEDVHVLDVYACESADGDMWKIAGSCQFKLMTWKFNKQKKIIAQSMALIHA